MAADPRNIVWLEETGRGDVARVGGKNASLGEMIRTLSAEGIRVPAGFATTADAFWRFVNDNMLPSRISALIADYERGRLTLAEAGRAIRIDMLHGEWPADIAADIASAYVALCERSGGGERDVAVRSSATAEDLPEASFAGQQETYLNIRGQRALLDACRRCYASL
ncbi:MAG: phosphoenolpyruvate synthase, partial [Bauldia sp.]|nr:phosphoenolpyruvate synthase [Bauldia sp.]